MRSLSDVGYTVDTAAADAFFLTLSMREGRVAPGAVLLEGNVPEVPKYGIDEQGRTMRLR